jgi:hypothetical protein
MSNDELRKRVRAELRDGSTVSWSEHAQRVWNYREAWEATVDLMPPGDRAWTFCMSKDGLRWFARVRMGNYVEVAVADSAFGALRKATRTIKRQVRGDTLKRLGF